MSVPANTRTAAPWFRHWPRGLPRQLSQPQVTLSQNLATAAQRFPQRPAIVFYDSVLGYAELKARSDALAAHLQQRADVQRGDRVLLLSQNCPQFVIAFHAIQRCGAVVVPVNAMSTAGELDHYIEDSGARFAFVAQELLPAVRPALQRGALRQAVVICYADALTAPTDLAVPAWLRTPPAALDSPALTAWSEALSSGLAPLPVELSPDDLCLLPYTSGTTGRPKGCMHSHRTLTASSVGAVLWRGLHAESVIFGVAPLFHLLGMQNVRKRLAAAS